MLGGSVALKVREASEAPLCSLIIKIKEDPVDEENTKNLCDDSLDRPSTPDPPGLPGPAHSTPLVNIILLWSHTNIRDPQHRYVFRLSSGTRMSEPPKLFLPQLPVPTFIPATPNNSEPQEETPKERIPPELKLKDKDETEEETEDTHASKGKTV